ESHYAPEALRFSSTAARPPTTGYRPRPSRISRDKYPPGGDKNPASQCRPAYSEGKTRRKDADAALARITDCPPGQSARGDQAGSTALRWRRRRITSSTTPLPI